MQTRNKVNNELVIRYRAYKNAMLLVQCISKLHKIYLASTFNCKQKKEKKSAETKTQKRKSKTQNCKIGDSFFCFLKRC